jgi:hypothetical protein
MKRLLSILVTFLLLVIPAQVFAKGPTVKITIKGAALKSPIEITDPEVLTKFQVWSGPGTSSSAPGFNPNAPGFVVDWSQRVAEPPKGLRRYEVSFYAKVPDERLVYVVFYEYDPTTDHGYIYLPGRTDEWYRLNVSTIYHGVEGRWFRAWSAWERVVRPLIANAKIRA